MSLILSPGQKQFEQTYPKLPEGSQIILKCLSIIYTRVDKSALISCCLEISKSIKNTGQALTTKDVPPLLDELEGRGFVKRMNNGYSCTPEIVELAARCAVVDGDFSTYRQIIYKHLFDSYYSRDQYHYFLSFEDGVRAFRVAFYEDPDKEFFFQILDKLHMSYPEKFFSSSPIDSVLFNPPDAKYLDQLPIEFVISVITQRLNKGWLLLEDVNQFFSFFEQYTAGKGVDEERNSIIAFYCVGRGDLKKLHELMNYWPDSPRKFTYLGWAALLQGDHDKSIGLYRQGLKLLQRQTGKRKISFQNLAGIFYPVALLFTGENANMKEALQYVRRLKKKRDNFLGNSIAEDLEQTLLYASGQRSRAEMMFHSSQGDAHSDYMSYLFSLLTLNWQEREIPERKLSSLHATFQKAEKAGYIWIAKEVGSLLLKTGRRENKFGHILDTLKRLDNKYPFPSLSERIQPREKWEILLDALENLKSGRKTKAGNRSGSNERLVWLFDFDEESGDCDLIPRLQKQGKNGKWTKGRAVALSTLTSKVNTLNYLTDQDRRIVSSIKKTRNTTTWGYYSRSDIYEFQLEQALPALVGHPLIFAKNNKLMQLELVEESPEIRVLAEDDGYSFTLYPEILNEKYALICKSPAKFAYIPCNRRYKAILEIAGFSTKFPLNAKERVVKTLSSLTTMLPVQSDIGGIGAEAREVEADSRPYIHLMPYGHGLQFSLFCKPLAAGGSYYRPGIGGKTVLAEVDGSRVKTTRDLEQEKRNVGQFLQNCPGFCAETGLDNEWLIESPEVALELLVQLKEAGDSIILEWPKGETMSVTREISSRDCSLHIAKDRDWFAMSGELVIDDNDVLDMKKLLSLLQGKEEGRFIRLDDGRFMALSRELRRRLDELQAYSELHGKGVRFHGLASLALENFIEEAGTSIKDRNWKENIRRFHNVPKQKIPSTLRAELREYQKEGVRLLGALSALEVGACLADDMGLGKTLQALAVILKRAPKGPALVIAPTSVMANWAEEAARFAPTLRVKFFAEGDRKKLLDSVQPFDLVICSYGLLQSEIEKLSAIQWQNVVLDEAQAIKNRQTKRSKAAMKLQAKFRLITTGTPIENHLGDLWTLFRFINPGLLGSYENFQKKFANPIEKNQDREASRRLKKLIQPFILRRQKHTVLQELPERTEITLHVEMNREEAAMYEVQRRQAVEMLEKGQAGPETGTRHLQVLAEITRLRRFCCNPELVIPGTGVGSAKLELFTSVVQELLVNGHKALVFSQFVGHLELLKKRLDQLGITYQYLDGSTPARKRAQRVKAFQSGEGDLFLISLKAGGSGLNLTAADYVIHMDPWWNPAVEAQASDRVHRIGQKRPVTIYRLVVKNSIEEKIVALHKEKKDLADSLLSGSDTSGKISTEELLALLKEQ